LSLQFQSAIAASRGARRYQEDTALVWNGGGPAEPDGDVAQAAPSLDDGRLLAVLGDGMGGHVGGATASRLACDAFAAQVAGADAHASDRLLAGLEAANRAVAEKIAARPMFKGMGTTLVGALFGPDGLSWTSVGDSLLYLWRRGELARLNEDHSMAPEIDRLVAAGKMSERDAAADPRRHYLRAAVTGDEIELIDVALKPLQLAAGDVVILASDGIHSLDEPQIADLVRTTAETGAEAIAAALIEAVDRAGLRHQDNTTVIAVTISSRSQPPLADL
jgi:protein phosphatase